MQHRRLYDEAHGLYGAQRLGRRAFEHLWPFATAWSALCTAGSLSGHAAARDAAGQLLGGVAHYRRGGWRPALDAGAQQGPPVGFESAVVPPLGPGGDVYYDDNAWIGLALVALHDLTGEAQALRLAQRLLAFVVGGWSVERSWQCPGGIRWQEPAVCQSRNTCANAPAAQLAALVHERTGDRDALAWAVRIDDWVHGSLVRDDGLVADRIDPDGSRDPAVWSYNQGTVIGAGVALHRVTGDRRYLDRAVRCAAAAASHFTPAVLSRQDPPFNAVYLRNALLLDRVVPDPAWLGTAVAYGDMLWRARDRRTGLLGSRTTPLNDTAAMLQVQALVAGATPHP